jgi:hypothetical protein
MIHEQNSVEKRCPREEHIDSDLCVVGGGLAGVCAAITAARAGLRVVLIQDRPVLGGNASSEVRLWILGATSHMGNNNRWAREGGVIDEILVENTWRNPEGNPCILDSIILEKTTTEPNIRLLLNTAVHDLEKADADTIGAVRAWCSQNETAYTVRAPLFCDASGDGIVGFLSGAAFRIGQEARDEFGELYAPEEASGELLGHTLYFTSKDTGQPVAFIPPANALDMDAVRKIRRYRGFDSSAQACNFWWLEYGGRLDTIHQSEEIKQELWRVVYGVWNYIKNSGEFPDAETLTLEWVGTIPGKRESRRFEGDCMLVQQDIVEQREHPDVVSYGGWAIDVHPVDGLYSDKSGCTQWHSKGVYGIPYRCLYSRNIKNLLLAGRIISASHVAFASTRVMATCAHNAQAVGMAAALCRRHGELPAGLVKPDRMAELQRELLRVGQYIPGKRLADPEDLAQQAAVSASGSFTLCDLPPNGQSTVLDECCAIMLPVAAGPIPRVTFTVDTAQATTLNVELRRSSKPDNHTPDVCLVRQSIEIEAGSALPVEVAFEAEVTEPCYLFYCLMQNPTVSVQLSDRRVAGVLKLHQRVNGQVAKSSTQSPPEGIGVERFDFWLPERRPGGKNLACHVDPPLALFGPDNAVNGVFRPVAQPNAWVSDPSDPAPTLTLTWDEPQTVREIVLSFDTDFDHAMESVLRGHPENTMPACVRAFRITDHAGTVLAEVTDNHQTRRVVLLAKPTVTTRLAIVFAPLKGAWPAALFGVQCYA